MSDDTSSAGHPTQRGTSSVSLTEKTKVRTNLGFIATVVLAAIAITSAVVHLDYTVSTVVDTVKGHTAQIDRIETNVGGIHDALVYYNLIKPAGATGGGGTKMQPRALPSSAGP